MKRMLSDRLRWLLLCLVVGFLMMPMGCYCTNWRWIWETDDDYCICQYEPPMTQSAP